MNKIDFYTSLNALLYRIFLNNVDNVKNIIDYYSTNDFLFGKSYLWDLHPILRSIFYIFNLKRINTYAEFITSELNPYSDGSFVMTPTIIGVAYANFSYLGVLLIFLINIMNFIISKYLIKTKYLLPLYFYYILISGFFVSRDWASVFSLFLYPVLLILFFLSFIGYLIDFCVKIGIMKRYLDK